ncbi:hypothetical protein M9Y10_036077 [Tritrichomonas musculus]|uniref:Uncharacterized protein n=1 Tax=Tritrichomonas musculus TaxID=1915356 RepID=A0ABR2GW03_9EUKA
MFIFFFNLATFILKKNNNNLLSSKNQPLIKATQLTKVTIQGSVQAGKTVTAMLEPEEANTDDSGITYIWEIETDEVPGGESSSEGEPGPGGESSSEGEPGPGGESSSEGEPGPGGESSSEGEPGPGGESSSEGEPGPGGESSSEGEPGPGGESSSEGEPGPGGESSSEGEPGPGGESSSEGEPGPGGESSSEGEPGPGGESSSEGEPGPGGESSSEGEPGPGGESSSEGEPGPGGESSSEGEPGPGGESSSEGEPGPGGESSSEGEPGPGGESSSEGEPGPGVESSSEGEPGPGGESSSEGEPGPGGESSSEGEPGPGGESSSEGEPGPGGESSSEGEPGPGGESSSEGEPGPGGESSSEGEPGPGGESSSEGEPGPGGESSSEGEPGPGGESSSEGEPGPGGESSSEGEPGPGGESSSEGEPGPGGESSSEGEPGPGGESSSEGEPGPGGESSSEGEPGPGGESSSEGEPGPGGESSSEGEPGPGGESSSEGEPGPGGESSSEGEPGPGGESSSEGEPGPGGESSSEGEPGPGGESSSEGEPGPGGESSSEGEPGPGGESSSEGEPGPGGESSSEGEPGPGVESSSEGEAGAQILETTGWKQICNTKQCNIPNDAKTGSKIKVTATGNGDKFTGSVESTSTIISIVPDESSSPAIDITPTQNPTPPVEPTSDIPSTKCAIHLSGICLECYPGQPTNCSKCDESANYLNRNGACQYCPLGFNSNKDGCKLPCPIEHCRTDDSYYCYNENGIDYCTWCEDGYETNEDDTACVEIKEIPPPSANACLEEIVGCTKCQTENAWLCDECNAEQHYQLNYGYCSCQSEYYDHNDKCLDKTTLKCPESIKFCDYCLDNKCIKCQNDYYLVNNVCTSLSDCSIENCQYCRYDSDKMNFVCSDCKENYTANADGACILDKRTEECGHIIGCGLCSTVLNDLCFECDSERHFTFSQRTGQCICDSEYDFVDGECLPPIPAVQRPEEERPITNLNSADNLTITGDSNATFTDEKSLSSDALYSLSIGDNIKTLNIPEKVQDIILTLENRNSEFTIAPVSDTTKVTVECENGANLIVPSSNKNLNINGFGTINLNPKPEKEGEEPPKELQVEKVIPVGKDGMKFESTVENLILDTIQVFGRTSIEGPSKDGQTATCNHLYLEGRSNFVTKNIKLEKVKIGLLSRLLFDKTVDVNNSKFEIFYNRPTNEGQYPIRIEDALPQFANTNIRINRIELNKTLPEDQASNEKILIAEFHNENSNYKEIMASCDKLRESFTDSEGFGNAKCINGSDPDQDIKLVAERVNTDKDGKKKLSGGAIAGIVIACIVVVAAIIALLVYFLVIKKRNQSTTSTQGDSSIAI